MKTKQIIAIYGLGQETQKNIDCLSEKYSIVGLLDSYQDDGELYGIPIISLDDAIRQGVKLIIVVARPGSCKAIVRNIGSTCSQAGINLIDIRGNNLLKKRVSQYNFEDICGYKKADLLHLINRSDVISFDLFDTLIMRKTLYFEDLLEIIAHEIGKNGLKIQDFVTKRLKAEIELSREKVPSLQEIYSYMLHDFELKYIDKLTAIEYENDKKILIARTDMVDLLNYSLKEGKKVCITTDTYYSEEQIRGIIKKCGINADVDVLTSCDNKTSKSQNLFEVLKNKFSETRIVHIGDDEKADVESAKEHGIFAFRIFNGRDILELVGGFGIADSMSNLSDRIKVGMFVSKIFNTPFVFDEDGISLRDTKEIGYVLFSPMIMDFTWWIGKKAQSKKAATVLFTARDGFVLQKIYDILFGGEKSFYFLTSRIAALRACIENETDIDYIEGTKFSGSNVDKLLVRYGLTKEECIDYADENYEGVMSYKSIIFHKAVIKKKNYLKYIRDNITFNEGEIFFVDLSARGTIQMFCERLLEKKVKGLYFLQLDPEFAKTNDLSIESFFAEDGDENNTIFDDFYIMEPVISSPDSSVDEFDEKGNPIFSQEERSAEEIDSMIQIQEGMLEYVSDFVSICPRSAICINKKLDEGIFRLIHTIKITSESFWLLRNIDPFVNRITDIKTEV